MTLINPTIASFLPGVRGRVAQQTRDVQIVECVKHLAARPADPHQPCGSQNSELMRRRRLGQAGLGRQIGDRALAMTDKVKQRQTRWIPENLEEGRDFRDGRGTNDTRRESGRAAHYSYEYMSKCSYVKFKAHVVAFCFATALSHPVLE